MLLHGRCRPRPCQHRSAFPPGGPDPAVRTATAAGFSPVQRHRAGAGHGAVGLDPGEVRPVPAEDGGPVARTVPLDWTETGGGSGADSWIRAAGRKRRSVLTRTRPAPTMQEHANTADMGSG